MALIGGFSASLPAQDSAALLNVLVRKGIVTAEEAKEIRAELSADAEKAVVSTVSGGKATRSISVYGRLHGQYTSIGTDAIGVEDTNHMFLRRVRLGVKSGVGENWTADVNYDFAAGTFDKGFVQYKGAYLDTPFELYFGLRKVNIVKEELNSSSSLPALERAGTTRFFVESNNGRRLGAASYRVGIFLDANTNARKGKEEGVFYGVAITNPERAVKSDDAAFAGTFENNSQALWADFGYSLKLGADESLSLQLGAGGGHLPKQGGRLSFGDSDLTIYNAYATGTYGAFGFLAEYLESDVENGVAVGEDANPWGGLVEISYRATDQLQLVGRYSYTNSDRRGIKVSDGVRSAPASFTGNNLTEYYLGLNYYVIGNDLKFQLGYVRGWVEKNGTEEVADGLRSQVAVNF